MAALENEGTWGNKENIVFQLLENAIAGRTSITVTGGSRLLTDTDLVANEARKASIKISGTLTSNATIHVPNRSKIWNIENATTGSYTLTLATPSVLDLSSIVGTFEVGETVTGGTSGATAIVLEVNVTDLKVGEISGTFQAAESISGGTSSATATVDTITLPTTTAEVDQTSAQNIYCDGSGNIFFLSIGVVPSTGAPSNPGVGTQAANVAVTAFGNLASTNLQAALEELQADIDAINTALALKQAADADLDAIGELTPNQGTILAYSGLQSRWVGLSRGVDGQQLQADSAQALGVKWVTPEVDGDTKTKGRIWGANGTTFEPLDVGANNTVLVADSGQTTGFGWGAAGISSNTVTNAMLANMATDTVKGRNTASTGDPEDVTMAQLATLITSDAAALAVLQAVIVGFDPVTDVRGTTQAGTITIPTAWTNYRLFGFIVEGDTDDPDVMYNSPIYRATVTRSVEPTQTPSDYSTAQGTVGSVSLGNFTRGFLIAVKVS